MVGTKQKKLFQLKAFQKRSAVLADLQDSNWRTRLAL